MSDADVVAQIRERDQNAEDDALAVETQRIWGEPSIDGNLVETYRRSPCAGRREVPPLREAYPPVGKPVRLWRDGRDQGVRWLVVSGYTTKFYQWKRKALKGWHKETYRSVDETRDAWEAV